MATMPRNSTARSLLVAVAGCAVLLAGCAAPRPTGPTLHTIDVEGTQCGGVGFEDATLHGSPTDPRLAWIELKGVGEQQAIFPAGFTARFAPDLEIRDATGTVVFREGDKIEGGCGAGGATGILLGWP